MRDSQNGTNPYDILGVELDASLEQIADAYRLGKADAARTNPGRIPTLDTAFEKLRDPEQRARVTKAILERAVLEDVLAGGDPSPMPVSATVPRSASPPTRWALLAVVLVALAVTGFQALRGKDAYCNGCGQFSVKGVETSSGDIRFSCSRPECDFVFTYDKDADEQHEHDPDGEASEENQARVSE